MVAVDLAFDNIRLGGTRAIGGIAVPVRLEAAWMIKDRMRPRKV
jgi:hypothetical protein